MAGGSEVLRYFYIVHTEIMPGFLVTSESNFANKTHLSSVHTHLSSS